MLNHHKLIFKRTKGETLMKHTEMTIVNRPAQTFLQNIADMQNRIARRAYDLFAASGFTDGHDLADWFLAESEVFGKTPIELSDNDKEFTITAGMPGFTEKDLEIRVEPRRVFITGKREEKSEDKKKGETFYSERSNEVFRSIDLPVEVDPDKVKATLSKGELEITLPKKEIGKKVVVEPKAA
jgi:HSP20 family molecular chaperone IbpA